MAASGVKIWKFHKSNLLTKQKKPLSPFGTNSDTISWHELVEWINTSHICTILLERIWHWYVYMFFSQLSTSALLTKLDLATNSWWQRWQLCCLFRQQAKLFPSHVWSNVCLVSFWNEMLFAACFFLDGTYSIHTHVRQFFKMW